MLKLLWQLWVRCLEDTAYCPFDLEQLVSMACLLLDEVCGCWPRVAMKGSGMNEEQVNNTLFFSTVASNPSYSWL